LVTQNRKEECGEMFDMMKSRLALYSKQELLKEANAFCANEEHAGHEIPWPGRIDRRHRTSLIAWYCRYYQQILDDSFVTDVPLMKQRGPRRNHPRIAVSLQSSTEGEILTLPSTNSVSDEDTDTDVVAWDCKSPEFMIDDTMQEDWESCEFMNLEEFSMNF
jgi:hypothetical protein